MSKDKKKKKKFGMVPMHVVMAVSSKTITAENLVVYAALASFASKKDGSCFPTNETLALLTGYTRNYISKAVGALIKARFVVIKGGERRAGKRNYYFLTKHPIGKAYELEKEPKEQVRDTGDDLLTKEDTGSFMNPVDEDAPF